MNKSKYPVTARLANAANASGKANWDRNVNDDLLNEMNRQDAEVDKWQQVNDSTVATGNGIGAYKSPAKGDKSQVGFSNKFSRGGW